MDWKLGPGREGYDNGTGFVYVCMYDLHGDGVFCEMVEGEGKWMGRMCTSTISDMDTGWGGWYMGRKANICTCMGRIHCQVESQ